jgi:hypothetical protein
MKTLKNLNSIALFIPLFLLLFGLINPLGYFLATYSTIITGILQVIIGIVFWTRSKRNLNIKIYFSLVFLFFSLWYYNVNIKYIDLLTWPLIFTPLFLSTYLSIIIYNQKETK